MCVIPYVGTHCTGAMAHACLERPNHAAMLNAHRCVVWFNTLCGAAHNIIVANRLSACLIAQFFCTVMLIVHENPVRESVSKP